MKFKKCATRTVSFKWVMSYVIVFNVQACSNLFCFNSLFGLRSSYYFNTMKLQTMSVQSPIACIRTARLDWYKRCAARDQNHSVSTRQIQLLST